MRIAQSVIIAIAVLADPGVSPAQTQQGNNEASAEQLFMQGRELFKQGKFDEAYARFKASHEFDPALGTLLNMALCREQQGKLVSARALYLKAAIQAGREGQAKRETVARERAQALEAELPRLIIEVAEASQVPGLSVMHDGTVVDATLFGKAVYVDPGWHRVRARAPGYNDFVTDVAIEKGEETSVAIPVLERAAGVQDESGEPAVQMTRRTKRYRSKIVTADLISLGAIGVGIPILAIGAVEALGDGEIGAFGTAGIILMGGGFLSLMFTPALIHNAQGNSWGGWKSIGVRVGLPLLGGLIEAGIRGDCDSTTENCSGPFLPGLLFLGGVVVDWFLFAKVDVNVQVTPYAMPTLHGGAVLGLTGRF